MSAAMRRASGVAKIRVPSFAGAAGAGVAGLSEPPLGAASAPASAFGASGALAGAAPRSSALSPSSSKTAMTSFTLTPSVPSATMILPMTPSSTASNSIVALSVSISAIRSPDEMVSPSFTSHLASFPSSIVGERAGMRSSIGISSLLNGR